MDITSPVPGLLNLRVKLAAQVSDVEAEIIQNLPALKILGYFEMFQQQ